jgi:superfamily II DNA helicase RecQ
VPVFRILADQTLLGIAALRPATEEELLAVGGIGSSRLRKYGARLLEIVESQGPGGRGRR